MSTEQQSLTGLVGLLAKLGQEVPNLEDFIAGEQERRTHARSVGQQRRAARVPKAPKRARSPVLPDMLAKGWQIEEGVGAKARIPKRPRRNHRVHTARARAKTVQTC